MQPFAVFSLHDDRVRMPAHRGAALGIWLVQICVVTTRGSLQTEIKTAQPCTFDELRSQLLTTEINDLFDDIEANADERTVNASFTVYKLRSTGQRGTRRAGRNAKKAAAPARRAPAPNRRTHCTA